jgi:hypothetical protein
MQQQQQNRPAAAPPTAAAATHDTVMGRSIYFNTPLCCLAAIMKQAQQWLACCSAVECTTFDDRMLAGYQVIWCCMRVIACFRWRAKHAIGMKEHEL